MWIPVCKCELHDARPPEPGHASDHYRFLRWTKSESGCQATSIDPLESRACCGRIFRTTIHIIEFVFPLSCNGINLRAGKRNVPRSYASSVLFQYQDGEFLISYKSHTYLHIYNQTNGIVSKIEDHKSKD